MDPAQMHSIFQALQQQQQLQQQQAAAAAAQDNFAAALAANPLFMQSAAAFGAASMLPGGMGVPTAGLGMPVFAPGMGLSSMPGDLQSFHSLDSTSALASSHSAQSAASSQFKEDNEKRDGDELLPPGRRSAHIAAEQKRRNNIRVGFQDLQSLLPSFKAKGSSQKLSKSAILYQSMDYISNLSKAKTDLSAEVHSLRNEAAVLKNLNFKYQQAAAMNPGSLLQPALPTAADSTLSPEHIKFQLFRSFLEKLYVTFDQNVQLHDLETLSRSVNSWLVDQCTREQLLDIAMDAVNDVSARNKQR